MREKISLGFHTCVDYELVWNADVVNDAITRFDITDGELREIYEPASERELWISSLAYLKAGKGCDLVPKTAEICEEFANRFQYEVTLGGTATRAALGILNIGIESTLLGCSYNKHIKRLMPEGIDYYPSVGKDHDVIYPHVILTYLQNQHIHGNDIDFYTPRENRLMYTRDTDSTNMYVSPDDYPAIEKSEVFLIGSFSQVLEPEAIDQCIHNTNQLLAHLPEDAIVVAEDGMYVIPEFRTRVHKGLGERVDVLSMNEDELQDYIGKRIDVTDAQAVWEAVSYVYEQIPAKTLVVHSAVWALAYGKIAPMLTGPLTDAIILSGTRFRVGDALNAEECDKTRACESKAEGLAFCEAFKKLAGEDSTCVPCVDLSFVENPTVVGLGDTFIGGFLPGLLKDRR